MPILPHTPPLPEMTRDQSGWPGQSLNLVVDFGLPADIVPVPPIVRLSLWYGAWVTESPKSAMRARRFLLMSPRIFAFTKEMGRSGFVPEKTTHSFEISVNNVCVMHTLGHL